MEAGGYYSGGAELPAALGALRAEGEAQAAAAHALGGLLSHLREVLLDKQVRVCVWAVYVQGSCMCCVCCAECCVCARHVGRVFASLPRATGALKSTLLIPCLRCARCWRRGAWIAWLTALASALGWRRAAAAASRAVAGRSAWPWMGRPWRTSRCVRCWAGQLRERGGCCLSCVVLTIRNERVRALK